MKVNKSFLVVAVLGLILLSAGHASASEKEDLKEIFDAAVTAVGDRNSIGKVRRIYAAAACTGPRGKYATTINSVGPDRLAFDQKYENKDARRLILNGDIGWNIDSDKYSPEVISPFERMVVRLHEYQRMAFDFESMFSDFKTAGDGRFNGRAVHKVAAKSKLGWPAHLFFDMEKRSLIGYELMMPQDGGKVVNRFEEWRIVKGLKLPSKVTAIDSKGTWTLDFHTIRLNSDSNTRYEVPRAVNDMAELLRLHKVAQTAHLTYDAELFISIFADELTQVQAGSVVTRNKEENLERFKEYFRTFKFTAWENIVPPVIKISNDGSMATVRVQKRVAGDYTDPEGKVHKSETIFAWLEVWEKQNGKWKVTTVASTRKQ
ncbi:MAG: nuclear transport factor 2 family protein [Pyrinomonadaceae bacterium]|nr:nuclear transport factor 2 family protein [Pyrinomonadaceae bacterium]